jgi:hypothetical protein
MAQAHQIMNEQLVTTDEEDYSTPLKNIPSIRNSIATTGSPSPSSGYFPSGPATMMKNRSAQIGIFSVSSTRSRALEIMSVEASQQSEQIWLDIKQRVLPLFNGEGLKGAIEDLNDLVRCANNI